MKMDIQSMFKIWIESKNDRFYAILCAVMIMVVTYIVFKM